MMPSGVQRGHPENALRVGAVKPKVKATCSRVDIPADELIEGARNRAPYFRPVLGAKGPFHEIRTGRGLPYTAAPGNLDPILHGPASLPLALHQGIDILHPIGAVVECVALRRDPRGLIAFVL